MANILKGNWDVHVLSELHYFERLWDVDTEEKFSRCDAVQLAAQLLHTVREQLTASTPWKAHCEEASKSLDSTQEDFTGFDIYRMILSKECYLHDRLRICDQTPRNIFYLDSILQDYPEGQVLIMVRDPRAILLSQKSKWKRREIKGNPIRRLERVRRWANYHPIVTSALWNAAINAGQRVNDNERVKVVHFEELVGQPEKAVKDICGFLGLSYNPAMLNVGQSMSPTGGKNKKPGHRSIDPTVADRWKTDLDATDLFWCEWVNSRNMESLGYPLTKIRPRLPALALSLLSLPFKVGLSAVLNGSKMRSIVNSIRRRFSK